MKVNISVFGRFHAFYLSQQLPRKNSSNLIKNDFLCDDYGNRCI